MSLTQPPAPVAADRLGDALWFLNDLAWIHLGGGQIGGRVSIVEFLCPAGEMPPLQRHDREDKLFYVVEGHLALHRPGQRTDAGTGGTLVVERGIAHAYEVLGDDPARFLIVTTPSGFEDFVAEISRHAEELSLPEPSEPDPATMAAVGERHGIALLGPPGTLP